VGKFLVDHCQVGLSLLLGSSDPVTTNWSFPDHAAATTERRIFSKLREGLKFSKISSFRRGDILN
jgi:hypothetical protein